MLDTLVCRVGVVAHRSADAPDLRGRDRRPNARSADEHRPIGGAVVQRLADLARFVRIVQPHGVGVGAEVDDVVAVHSENLEDDLPKVDAAMVERHGDSHQPTRVRSASERSTTPSAV